MHLPGLIEIPLRLSLLAAGLLVPGSMILRLLRLPWSLAAAFVISSATLYTTVLLFAWTGWPISLLTLAVALGLVSLAARSIPMRISTATHESSFACFSKMGGWLPLYLVFWGIVGYRVAFQPLTGPDVYFRWSYLAEQMLRFGSIDFYPPRSGPDFVRYFWAESIPPGIASLYAWAYGCAGTKQALWTSPVVALQLLSLHEIIWRLASRWGGEAVARRAVLLAAACPLLTWSFLIGQETGMTALSVAGLVWCLQNLRERNVRGWIVLAGIFAVVASGTREYGPVFAFAAVFTALAMRVPRKHILVLMAVSLPVALAWPLRAWLLTGNPVYSLNVGGFFPTNRIFVEWTEIFHRKVANSFSTSADWIALARYLTLWALPASFGVFAMIFLLSRRLAEARIPAFFCLIVVGLWYASIAHTGGGLFYSLRVLSPVFAIMVVSGSYGLGLLGRSPLTTGVTSVVIALTLMESLPKTLVLPENPYRLPLGDWPRAGEMFSQSVKNDDQNLISRIKNLPNIEGGRIVTDNAGLARLIAPIGLEALPLWSPEVSWLFDPNLSEHDVALRWQKSGLRYVFIAKASPTAGFFRDHARSQPPHFTVLPMFEDDEWSILQITVHTESLSQN